MYTYSARVTRVIDGDTIDCIVDLGFGLKYAGRFRLLGIDAPELHSPVVAERVKAQDSMYFLRKLVWDKDVVLKTTKSDSFGRYLAEVFLAELNVNQELLRQNHASVF